MSIYLKRSDGMWATPRHLSGRFLGQRSEPGGAEEGVREASHLRQVVAAERLGGRRRRRPEQVLGGVVAPHVAQLRRRAAAEEGRGRRRRQTRRRRLGSAQKLQFAPHAPTPRAQDCA